MTADETATPARGSFILLAITGAIGGILSGAFGVGGGVLMVPLLINLVGMDQRRAASTSLVAILPTAIVGSLTYLAKGEVDVWAAVFLAIGAVVGSYLGSQLLRRIPLGVLRWLFIALLVVIAVRMLVVVPPRGGGEIDITWWSAAGLIGVGLFIGVASGLFGIGGGVIIVPALIALFGAGDLIAKGTSLLVMIPTSISGTVGNIRNRAVDVRAGLIVGITATLFSFVGVAIAFIMPPLLSSILFAVLLLVAAAQLAVRAWRMRKH